VNRACDGHGKRTSDRCVDDYDLSAYEYECVARALSCIIGVGNARSPIMHDHGYGHVARLGSSRLTDCAFAVWKSQQRGPVVGVVVYYMTRNLNVTPKTTARTAHLTARSHKSVTYVTNNKRLYSTFCAVGAITTDRHEASRGFFVTAE